jgi:hypothetical protein
MIFNRQTVLDAMGDRPVMSGQSAPVGPLVQRRRYCIDGLAEMFTVGSGRVEPLALWRRARRCGRSATYLDGLIDQFPARQVRARRSALRLAPEIRHLTRPRLQRADADPNLALAELSEALNRGWGTAPALADDHPAGARRGRDP